LPPKKHLLIISLLLTVATLMAFWQVTYSDFINFDDGRYVTENRHIQDGLTVEAIRWAFTTLYAEFWHPLTWLSHLVDVQLFGLDPRGHHLTNLLLHLASTLLLFLVFHRMTKALWQSAFVAALFALHPLHVESVAWVADRKDVLSAFFWILTMGAYAFYVERPGLKRYLAILLSFALGLMAKPMLVTLPFALLLLDYWPLQRFAPKKAAQEIRTEGNKQEDGDRKKGKSRKKQPAKGEGIKEKTTDPKNPWVVIRLLLLEKIPLFAMTVLSSFLAYIAQQGEDLGSVGGAPPSERLANAFISYIVYLGKMFWPTNLAVYYPYPGARPFWQVLGAVFFFIAVMLLAIRAAKRVPYLAVGWLWYVGTLVPVIGIVQVGRHAMADRYTYIPLIGLFIIVAWGVPELSKNWRFRKKALIALPALCILCLFLLTWRQVGYWRNSITLFDHVLKVTDRNAVAYNNRGTAYGSLGNYRQAIEDYNKATELNPKYELAYNNRGYAYGMIGNHRQAIEDYDKAIVLNPEYAEAYYNRAITYGKLGNHRQAIEDYNKAIELNPKYALAYYNRGIEYVKFGNHRQAIEDYNKAIALDPKSARAYNNRGTAYGSLGNYRQAVEDCNKAIELNPKYALAYNNRGYAYEKLGNHRQAIEDIKTAARLGNESAQNFLKSQAIGW
jgi:protein O-mannosyl-transferase